jgi:hypothetical protein
MSFKKQYKKFSQLMCLPRGDRVEQGPDFLVTFVNIVHAYAPSLSFNYHQVIRGCDRVFRISSSRSGNVYISDFEVAYNLVTDKKNSKFLTAELVSNHAVCRHDAGHICVDHKNYIFFRELSAFSKETLMMFEPKKPAPKRLASLKVKGDRCLYCDGFVHEKKEPKCSIVFMKNGESCITKYRIPNKSPSKFKTVTWNNFDGELPMAESMIINKRHDCIFFLEKDYDLMQLDLYGIILPKDTKKQCNIIPIKTWNKKSFAKELKLCAVGDKYFPSAVSMCFLRSVGNRNGVLAVAIEKHLYFVCEDPRKGRRYEFYDYYVGRSRSRLYDITEDPNTRRGILAVDGVIKNAKLSYYNIL